MNKICKPDEVEYRGVCKKMDINLARRIIYTDSPKDIIPLIKAAQFVFDKWADLKIVELDALLGRKPKGPPISIKKLKSELGLSEEEREKLRKRIHKKYVEY